MSVPFSEWSRAEKDAFANKRMAEMKILNAKLKQRYDEVQQDRIKAEESNSAITSAQVQKKEKPIDQQDKSEREWDKGKLNQDVDDWQPSTFQSFKSFPPKRRYPSRKSSVNDRDRNVNLSKPEAHSHRYQDSNYQGKKILCYENSSNLSREKEEKPFEGSSRYFQNSTLEKGKPFSGGTGSASPSPSDSKMNPIQQSVKVDNDHMWRDGGVVEVQHKQSRVEKWVKSINKDSGTWDEEDIELSTDREYFSHNKDPKIQEKLQNSQGFDEDKDGKKTQTLIDQTHFKNKSSKQFTRSFRGKYSSQASNLSDVKFSSRNTRNESRMNDFHQKNEHRHDFTACDESHQIKDSYRQDCRKDPYNKPSNSGKWEDEDCSDTDVQDDSFERFVLQCYGRGMADYTRREQIAKNDVVYNSRAQQNYPGRYNKSKKNSGWRPQETMTLSNNNSSQKKQYSDDACGRKFNKPRSKSPALIEKFGSKTVFSNKHVRSRQHSSISDENILSAQEKSNDASSSKWVENNILDDGVFEDTNQDAEVEWNVNRDNLDLYVGKDEFFSTNMPEAKSLFRDVSQNFTSTSPKHESVTVSEQLDSLKSENSDKSMDSKTNVNKEHVNDMKNVETEPMSWDSTLDHTKSSMDVKLSTNTEYVSHFDQIVITSNQKCIVDHFEKCYKSDKHISFIPKTAPLQLRDQKLDDKTDTNPEQLSNKGVEKDKDTLYLCVDTSPSPDNDAKRDISQPNSNEEFENLQNSVSIIENDKKEASCELSFCQNLDPSNDSVSTFQTSDTPPEAKEINFNENSSYTSKIPPTPLELEDQNFDEKTDTNPEQLSNKGVEKDKDTLYLSVDTSPSLDASNDAKRDISQPNSNVEIEYLQNSVSIMENDKKEASCELSSCQKLDPWNNSESTFQTSDTHPEAKAINSDENRSSISKIPPIALEIDQNLDDKTDTNPEQLSSKGVEKDNSTLYLCVDTIPSPVGSNDTKRDIFHPNSNEEFENLQNSVSISENDEKEASCELSSCQKLDPCNDSERAFQTSDTHLASEPVISDSTENSIIETTCGALINSEDSDWSAVNEDVT